MLKVFQERDRIILDLGERRYDSLIDWRDIDRLVETLRARADDADDYLQANPPTIATGIWDAAIESYDGFVAMRFSPPFVGASSLVPLTPPAARKLADHVEFKGQQAAYKMRFVIDGDACYDGGRRTQIDAPILNRDILRKPRLEVALPR